MSLNPWHSSQQSRKEKALAWYAIHADEIVETWVAELWPLATNVESKALLRRRVSELRENFIHAIATDDGGCEVFDRSQGLVFAAAFGGKIEALTEARTLITRTLFSDLPAPLWPAVSRPFERAMTQFIWGYSDHATAVEREREHTVRLSERVETVLELGWYREIIEQHPMAIAVFRATDRAFMTGNAALVAMFGYSLDEFARLTDDEFPIETIADYDVAKLHELISGKIPYLVREQSLRHKDGRPIRFECRQWMLADGERARRYIVTECRLLHEQETLGQRAEKRFRHLAQLVIDPTFVVDRAGRITYATPSTMRGLGIDPDSLTRLPFMELILLEDHRAFTEFRKSLEEWPRSVHNVELRLYRSDGQWRWFELTGSNLLDVPEIEGFTLQARDITDRKRVEEWLSQQALIDPLTNLLNRRGVMSQIELMLERGEDHHFTTGLLFIDLDRFHTYNNRYGHETGDALLMEIGERLRFVLGGGSSAARLGGDEFVVLLENTTREQIIALADQIAATLSSPIEIGSNLLRVRANIGIVTSGPGRDTATALLRAADAAQYQAKAAGNGMPVIYTDGES